MGVNVLAWKKMASCPAKPAPPGAVVDWERQTAKSVVTQLRMVLRRAELV